ncbi:MAG: Fic family protein [Acholeplasmatales bacterium]|nr:Fic family protein [Acholeplasmatales bacterium]
MDNKDILMSAINSDKYFTNKDLRMNRRYGFLLSKKALDEYLTFKEEYYDEKYKIEFPLLTWNSKKIFLYFSDELCYMMKDYINYLKNDFKKNHDTYVLRNFNEVTIGMLCSELDGSLKIENVNTTRRQIEQIIEKNIIKDKNDRIVNNMFLGFKFIVEKPDFNKENLKKLYDILSDGCLDLEDMIYDSYYRNDDVYVGDYSGCPVGMIDDCMNSLFDFINQPIKEEKLYMKLLIPFIVHYYILYIHPYFDYNGRTARMVQLWLLLKNDYFDLYLSEAINDNKNDYYDAISDTRNSHNDLTYFVTYMFGLCNKYCLLHKNLEDIKETIESKGDTITNRELHYLKRIIINKKKGWFNYKKFNEFQEINISKAGALKILNNFEKNGFLISKINKSNEKIFLFNEDILKYELK